MKKLHNANINQRKAGVVSLSEKFRLSSKRHTDEKGGTHHNDLIKEIQQEDITFKSFIYLIA